MSKGKVDVSFIKHVATSDDFQREVIDHGQDNLLVVVDVFTGTWGPCNMLDQYFMNQFFEMGDNDYAIKFVRAKSDKIGALVQFHDSPMPHFLFYMNGEMVAKVEGPKMPELTKNMEAHAVKVA